MIVNPSKCKRVLVTECIAKKLAKCTYEMTGGKLSPYSIVELYEEYYKKDIGKCKTLNEHELGYIKECEEKECEEW